MAASSSARAFCLRDSSIPFVSRRPFAFPKLELVTDRAETPDLMFFWLLKVKNGTQTKGKPITSMGIRYDRLVKKNKSKNKFKTSNCTK